MNRTALTCTAIATLGIITAAFVTAGPLNPPDGPIASTGKTLTEIEPRIAINAINTPGDSDSLFKITQRGSYYLTEDLRAEIAKHGIEIAASHVTIDLNGFNLDGNQLALDGITTEGIRNNITVRNGIVEGWGGGGINLTAGGFGRGAIVQNIITSSNGGAGIHVPNDSIVVDCVARDNGTVGIATADNAAISRCVASGNGTFGFSVIRACVLTECSAIGNGTLGFGLNYGCVISNSTASENGTDGIVGFEGCTIVDCASVENSGSGIRVTTDCIVRNNVCQENGFGAGDAAGIVVNGGDNRIEGNSCTDADRGIDVNVAGNIIIRNTCSGNTTNWTIVAGNVCLVVNAANSAAINGNSGGVSPGSTDPNANFSY